MKNYKFKINKNLVKRVFSIKLKNIKNKIKKSILNIKINNINFKMFTKIHPLYKLSYNEPNILRGIYFSELNKFNYKEYVIDDVIYGDYKEPDILEEFQELIPVINEVNKMKNYIDIIDERTFELKMEKKRIKRKILTIEKR